MEIIEKIGKKLIIHQRFLYIHDVCMKNIIKKEGLKVVKAVKSKRSIRRLAFLNKEQEKRKNREKKKKK